MSRQLELVVDPPDGPIYGTPTIRLMAGEPGATATLRASMLDCSGWQYRSEASFRFDDRGVVDCAIHAPTGGSYDSVDAAGLLWSMRPFGERRTSELDPIREMRITVEATCGSLCAERSIIRRYGAVDIPVRDVRERDIVGKLYVPPSAVPMPAIIVLAGSGGGMDLRKAAALASQGYVTFALAYCGVEGLPDDIGEIPLEYLDTGARWLLEQPEVRGDTVTLVGTSKGGELALLLGATFRWVGAVVAYVPSGMVHPWPMNGEYSSSWSLGGEPVPFVGRPDSSRNTGTRPPFRIRAGYEAILEDTESVERAAIRVERTNGPILIISGDDDGIWPSTLFAEVAVRRLKGANFEHAFSHLRFRGAGHNIGLPNLPPALPPDEYFDPGGVVGDTARASRESWDAVLAFLRRWA